MRPVRIACVSWLLLCVVAPVFTQPRATPFAAGFSRPVGFIQDPIDRAVQFVVEQGGLIRAVRNGAVLAEPFLDVRGVITSDGERGLLGLAFPPDAGVTGRFYVNFTNLQGHTVVARFRRSSNPLVADPATRFDLRFNGVNGPALIEQPFSNHNGGHLAFGPEDGFLYIGMGDGGSGNDPQHLAQNPQSLLGKMLRIDVNVPDSSSTGYTVPDSNPFVGGLARPEIWSFGWRNPWRWSFDPVAVGGTGALLVGDVGQGAWEEIDYEPRGRGGRNYGWRNREGAHDNVTSLPPAYLPLTDPIHEYGRTVGQSVTGGFVYRGTAMTDMRGRYFFGDFIASRVWSLALTVDENGEARASDVREHTADLGGSTLLAGVSTFGLDADNELYVVSYNRGVIYKLFGPPGTPTNLRIIR